MKRPLAWHREDIGNFAKSLRRQREALDRDFAGLAARERRLDRMERELAQARRQLADAEAEGREDYDAGKYRGGRDALAGPPTCLGTAWESSGRDECPALVRVVADRHVPADEASVEVGAGDALPGFDLRMDQEPIPGGVLLRVRAVPPKARP